jgi:transposase
MQDNHRQDRPGRKRQIEGLPVVRRNVAGMDLGSERHWVCAPTADGVVREIADFGATTPELIRMRKWLEDRRVESVAMESTGVYWIAPHEVLEAAGMEILLVDTRQLAQVPGRDKKSDPTDCEWIQRLHSCGLLRGSFRPPEEVCMLRTLVRDKANLVAESGDWIRRMQKSLAARGESQKQFPWRMFRRKIALWRWERGVASRKNSGLQLAPWRALPAIRFMSG